MELVVLSIHLLVCICLIGLVLLQRSEGGALGMGGGGGGSLMSGRGAADALAKMTSVAGGFFLVTSLGLTMLSSVGNANAGRSVLDLIPAQSAPATTPAPAPTTPAPETNDPTESRAPSETQLVSIGPSEASAETSTTRAAPIPQRVASTTTTAAAPTQRPAATPASAPQRSAPPPPTTQQRTATTAPARTTPAQTTRSTPATTQPATTQPVPARAALAPATTTNGAVSGIDLTTDPQLTTESSEGRPARERAGPDQ